MVRGILLVTTLFAQTTVIEIGTFCPMVAFAYLFISIFILIAFGSIMVQYLRLRFDIMKHAFRDIDDEIVKKEKQIKKKQRKQKLRLKARRAREANHRRRMSRMYIQGQVHPEEEE